MRFTKVPSHHVTYLKAHKGDAMAYLLGDNTPRPPAGFLKSLFGGGASNSNRPDDWPTTEAEEISIEEANPFIMHFVLTGTNERVKGPANLFQVWLSLSDGASQRMSGPGGYAFLHDNNQVNLLFATFNSLDNSVLFDRWNRIVKERGYEEDDFEFDYVAECVLRLKICYEMASREGASVLWAPVAQ